ncbi:hypothetical protein ACFOWZ_32605 [Lentzea rhizosphaerae]|uniref:Uncharacterized protein n=1 Tax=Lentzea rhizosphaerae TaxID=2041025 RepID=A0ABV8C2J9_9PSEU
MTFFSAFLVFYAWSRERALLYEFGLSGMSSRPPLDYLLSTGVTVWLWSSGGVVLILVTLLLICLAEVAAVSARRRWWARRAGALVALGALGVLALGGGGRAHPLTMFTAMVVLWGCWLVHRRVRLSERVYAAGPLPMRMYAVDATLALMMVFVLVGHGFATASRDGNANAELIATHGTWVSVHSTQPLLLDRKVHGRFCEREDSAGAGYRFHYEGFRLIWTNGSRLYVLSAVGDRRTAVELDTGAVRVEYRNGNGTERPDCLGR